jgi:hypothetical protein
LVGKWRDTCSRWVRYECSRAKERSSCLLYLQARNRRFVAAAGTRGKLAGWVIPARAIPARAIQARAIQARAIQARAIQARAIQARAIQARAIQARAIQARAIQARAIQARAIQARAAAKHEQTKEGIGRRTGAMIIEERNRPVRVFEPMRYTFAS